MVEDRCALVAADVLLRIRLDILIKSELSVPEIMLYSSEKMNCTAHPRWDHLDEQLLLSEDDYLQDDDDLLANMYARFVAIRDNNDENPAAVEKDEIILAE
eukprot:scaffold5866_cov46-Skeletonema_menzelii.AAC.1